MEIHIVTIFPRMFASVFAESIIGRAVKSGLAEIYIHDLRKWTGDKRKTVDGRPFGGGPGMVMLLEPFYRAIAEIKSERKLTDPRVILTSAKGEQFTQKKAQEFSTGKSLIILCGHYEGVDERVRAHLVNEEISLGPYVLTGGELPAMAITDAVVRLLAGVLGNEASLSEESFSDLDKTEYPQYTRPASFTAENGEKWEVPEVLLNGNHREITEWRQKQRK